MVYPSRMLIDFSGTARQVRTGFHTEIHRLEVRGAGYIANVSDPQIPAALAPPYNGYEFGIGNQSSGVPNFWNGSTWQKASTAVNDNAWHSIAVSVGGSSETFYRDGAADATTGGGPASSFSGSGFLGNTFIGSIDEVRISNIARSADWIATEYNNQNSSSVFYSVGAAATSGP